MDAGPVNRTAIGSGTGTASIGPGSRPAWANAAAKTQNAGTPGCRCGAAGAWSEAGCDRHITPIVCTLSASVAWSGRSAAPSANWHAIAMMSAGRPRSLANCVASVFREPCIFGQGSSTEARIKGHPAHGTWRCLRSEIHLRHAGQSCRSHLQPAARDQRSWSHCRLFRQQRGDW